MSGHQSLHEFHDYQPSHIFNLNRNIMHDNMLVNVSGLEGHAMPIDLNIEHLIGELKVHIPNNVAFSI